MARAHVYVSGMVQRVFYRFNASQEARFRGVNGWIKNLPDGRVEAVFDGPKKIVEGMIEWCRTGSPGAQVDDVEVEWEEGDAQMFKGFEVRR